jgi:hypothetical protein
MTSKSENKRISEAIADGLKKYPTIDAIKDLSLPPHQDTDLQADRDMREAAEQLREVLTKCAVGVTKIAERFPRPVLERKIKQSMRERLEQDPKYSEHIRREIPGADIKKYGERNRTSTGGTFVKLPAYEDDGDLATLLTGGWLRVAKDRIDPVAWSFQFGLGRKTTRQRWLQHYKITERSGKQSDFELKREMLRGTGNDAIKQLLQSGVHLLLKRKSAPRALLSFLEYKPKLEIVRLPYVGFFKVDNHFIYVRSNEVLLPQALRGSEDLIYQVDNASDPDHYGDQLKATTADWQAKVAIPLRGNSNVTLAFGNGLASTLIPFANEQLGGEHLHGDTGWGKSAVLAAEESIFGLPSASQHRHSYGRSWGVTSTGLEDLLPFRNHAPIVLDDIHRIPRIRALRAAVVQMLYAFTQAPKTRGGPWRLHGGNIGQGFLLSSGEESIKKFAGEDDRGGRERRVPDIPAEAYPGARSAFETIDHDALQEKLPALYRAVIEECHGAPGLDWQLWLVEQLAEFGEAQLRDRIDRKRKTFLALPQVQTIWQSVQPELRSIIRRVSLYAAALHLARGANILPWTDDEITAGLVACLQRWAAQRENRDPASEEQRAAQQIASAIAANLADRFIHTRKTNRAWAPATAADEAKYLADKAAEDEQRKADRFDGYLKLDPKEGDLVLIRTEAWGRYCNEFDVIAMAEYFKQARRVDPRKNRQKPLEN